MNLKLDIALTRKKIQHVIENHSKNLWSTCTEVFVDETFDFLKLLEIRGLQVWEQVAHVELFPGHGDGGVGGSGGIGGVAGVEGRGFQVSLFSACCQGPWATHRRSFQAPLHTQDTFTGFQLYTTAFCISGVQ